MESPTLNVCIVGAGLGGLTAAIGIARSGHKVTILEQASKLAEVGAGIQIPPNSSRILQKWNLLPSLKSHSVLPHSQNLRSYVDGKILSVQETMPYCLSKYGAPYLHIHRADYHKVLVTEVSHLDIPILLNSRVQKIDFAIPAVYLENGEKLEYDLVIGADGLKSSCRECLSGKPNPPKATGDLAYRIVVKTSDMLQHPELVEFVENPAINIWMGPSSHAHPLQYRQLACPDNLPSSLTSSSTKADLEEMNERFRNWDPRLREILKLVKEAEKWRLWNCEPMDYWSNPEYPGNFVLMGDAAHATLPYLASGAAMAVEDGAVIGELMSKNRLRSKSQLGDIIRIFEGMRKERTERVVRESSAQGKTFHTVDGEERVRRDRSLAEAWEKPVEGCLNRWRDPVFLEWLWGYDFEVEVEKAWKAYEKQRDGKAGAVSKGEEVLERRRSVL